MFTEGILLKKNKNTCQPPLPGYVTDDIYSVIAPPAQ